MKYFVLTFVFLFITHISYSQNFSYSKDYERILSQTKDSSNTFYYPKLLKRFNKADSTLTNREILALMIGFTGQPNFMPYKYLSDEQAIYDLNDAGNFKSAILKADSLLAIQPLSQQALIEKSYAYYKLGRQDSSDYYSNKFTLIMKAMDWSSDGKTAETAKFSIGPADGQNFIQKYYHAKIGSMGSGSDSNGNFCDMLQMIDKKDESKKIMLYFVIEHAKQSMMAEFMKSVPKK